MKGLLVIGLLFSLTSFSQKIKSSGYDKSIDKWRIETFPVSLKSAPDVKMSVSLHSSGVAFSLRLTGSGIGTSTIDKDGQVIFLLDNDSTVIVKSNTIQSIEYGEASPTYKHVYDISFEGLESLSQVDLKALRKYSVGGFDDIYLEKKNAGKLRELSLAFIAELKKGNVVHEKSPLIPPGFPGGNEVLLSFLNRNLKMAPALTSSEPTMANVQFLVRADGSISDVQITKSAGSSLDTELLRILNRMPIWKPGVQNGKPVDALVTRSLSFFRAGNSFEIRF